MAASTTVESLTERLQRNPDSFVFSRLADHYRKAGNVDQAIDLCVKGLDRYPDSSIGHLVLGRCYLEQEKLERAVNEFISVCHIDRRNNAAIKMLADIFMRQGLLEKAADLYILLAKIDPFDALRNRTARPKKGSGAADLFEILGLSPALKSPSAGTGAPAAGRGGFADADRLPPVRPPAKAGTVKESTQFVSLDELGLSQADTVVADIGSATEELLSNASTVTGSDISDRMNALFGEALAAPPPRPAPKPEPTAAVFEAAPLPEKPSQKARQEDTSHKETIKMQSLKELPKAAGGMPLNIELEETMIIDADEAMLLRGGSGGRAKEPVPAEIDILEK
jgi:tetratricopeptide (TPR) repeat protein